MEKILSTPKEEPKKQVSLLEILHNHMLEDLQRYTDEFLTANKIIRGTEKEIEAKLMAHAFFFVQRLAEIQQVTLTIRNQVNKEKKEEGKNGTN